MFVKHISITVTTDKGAVSYGGRVDADVDYIGGIDLLIVLWRAIWSKR